MSRGERPRASLAERLYGVLLHAYPAALRHAHGQEMVRLYSDLRRRARRRRGGLGSLWLTLRVLTELPRSALATRLAERRSRLMARGRREPTMQDFACDLRLAVRGLRQHPGLTAVATLTLALGIGANTAIFSLVYGVLLRPLGVEAPERLVLMSEVEPASGATTGTSPSNLDQWRRSSSRTFDGMAASFYESVVLESDGRAESLNAVLATSGDYFTLLGLRPSAGRLYGLDDVVPDRWGQVVVLSYELWQRRWGGDPSVVGRTLRIEDRPVEVIGVLGPTPALYPTAVDAWMPHGMDPEDPSYIRRLDVIGRLAEGVSLEQAQAEIGAVSRRINEGSSEYKGWEVALQPVHEALVGEVRPALWVAGGAVALVLLIACANLANLLLARGASREREMAVRAALGASGWRVARQVLTESVALAAVGGTAGLGVALLGHRLIVGLAPGILPRLSDVRLDGSALVFTAVLALATGVLFGLAPARHAAKVGLNAPLKEGGRGPLGPREPRARSLLVVSQVALAVTLLTGSGLLIRSLLSLQRVDPGFDASGVVAGRIFLSEAEDAYPTPAQQGRYYETLLERLRALPGVVSAGATMGLPMDPIGIDFDSPYRPGGREAREDEGLRADLRVVTPSTFRTLGIELVTGRDFTPRDTPRGPPVAIVNEALARQAWPGEEPIGQRMTIFFGGAKEHEVVGVVANIRFRGLAAEPRPEMYIPFAFAPFMPMTVVAKTRSQPAILVGALRQEALALDPRQPVHSAFEVADLVRGSIADSRFYSWLLASFALVALLLAGSGIYGVIAYWVSRRTRELGVRMALGAGAGEVVGLVLRRGLSVTAVGVMLGVAGATVATRALRGLLFGVAELDPPVFLAVPLLLGLVALVACLLPAWRASRMDPVDSLRLD